jgi:hypothetical protein
VSHRTPASVEVFLIFGGETGPDIMGCAFADPLGWQEIGIERRSLGLQEPVEVGGGVNELPKSCSVRVQIGPVLLANAKPFRFYIPVNWFSPVRITEESSWCLLAPDLMSKARAVALRVALLTPR